MNTSTETLTWIDHYRELRRHLWWVALVWIAVFSICYWQAESIYRFLTQPLLNSLGKEHAASHRLIYTGLTEAFFTYIKLAFFAAMMISIPAFLIQIYRFMAPGLYEREKRSFRPFIIACPLLFGAGAAMCYYIVFPLAWTFFLSFEMPGGEGSLPLFLEARMGEYLSLVMQLILAFGLSFQMPIIIALMVKIGWVDVVWLKEKRKYAIITWFVIAAVITPPDVISQISLALPLVLLYELSILFCHMTMRTSC